MKHHHALWQFNPKSEIRNRQFHRQLIGWILGCCVAAFVPLGANAYQVDVLTTALLYALLALGLNLIVGFTGVLHLGYAALFAIGAYTYGMLNVYWHWPFWVGLAPAVLIAGGCGVLLGIP